MPHRTIGRIVTILVLAAISATAALAQSPPSAEPLANSGYNTWQAARQIAASKHKLLLVTRDQPLRRQTCRIQSFTREKLVCSRAPAGSRTYLPQQIVALILPGDHGLKLWAVLGFNAGLAAAILGTVALAAACPACAVATGIAALFLFGAAGAVLIGDEQPDSLLYLAPGQQLSDKLRIVKP